jgi:chromosome segregation ATPase
MAKAKTEMASVGGLIDEFYSTCSDLRDELQEWKDNIEEKFSGTDKYNTLEESVNNLEGFCENVPDYEIDGFDASAQHETIRYPLKKKASRRDRMGQAMEAANIAVSLIEAEIEKIENALEEANDQDVESETGTDHDVDALEATKDALTELKDQLENDVSEAENVEFPGMFG